MPVQYRSRQKFGMDAELHGVLSGLLRDHARDKLSVAKITWTDFTDNSTGTGGSTFPALTLPTAAYDANAAISAASAVVTTRGTGGSYVPGDILTLTGDTGSEPTFTITHTELRTAAVATSGTGADATGVTFTGSDGTGTKFTVTGDISTNTLSNITIVTRGNYTVNPTLATAPLTAAGYTGYELLVTMGAKTVALATAGSITTLGVEPHSTTTNSATGTGATLTVGWLAGVAETTFDTAAGKADNAMAVLAEQINGVFTALGIPVMTYSGTVATPGTVPAMDKTLAALSPASGSLALDFTTGRACMSVLRNNMATLIRAMNMIMAATGNATTADATGGSPYNARTLAASPPPYTSNPSPEAALVLSALPATTAGTGTAAGDTSISKAVMDAFLTSLANHVATLASKLNTLLPIANNSPLQAVLVD